MRDSFRSINAAIRMKLLRQTDNGKVYIAEGHISEFQSVLNEKSVKATAEKLYGGSLALTQSRIDSFVGCPLRYFCNYTLKLNPTGRAEFNAANIGTFIHEVLEKFFDTLKKKGTDIASITDEEKDSLIMAAAKGFAERYFEGIPKRSERLKTTIDRLCRSARPVVDGLCDEFANCKFAPKFFELAIDKNKPGNPDELTVPLIVAVKFRGTVDNVTAAVEAAKSDVKEEKEKEKDKEKVACRHFGGLPQRECGD